ncbi:hypothetical protein Val02_81160 [Virgisporangium aliadipatigenens]|uniref:2'-5' RNA ligase family protein n=1 Tax=Virgisporangium aliadipatigenens TaxID=741659 RepID=A0A8J3YWU2_9ACTN|nr:2'-5' RNA ligase family protein [Virgisporangium aliadipatigenens]GIJ51230.1 hypothetical protein Val02_81160 [Virgisporangium aliadipatigenens]
MTAEPVQARTTPQDEDWRRFSALSRMANHWDRPGWTDGRQAYYWYLTFDSPALRDLAVSCQRRLDLPFLDPVPPFGIHLTMPRIGWSDEVSPAEVQRIAEAAVAECSAVRRFDLGVGPLSGSAGAVRFSVTPWEQLVLLHDRLRGAVASVLGPGRPAAEFRPHVGIAYCNRAVPAAPLVARVATLRALPLVTVPVDRVELVLVRRQERAYAWTTLESLMLR